MMNPLDQFIVRPIFGNFKFGINTFTLDTILVAGVTFWVFYLLLVSNKNLSHLYTFAIGPGLKTLSYGAVVGSKRYRPLYVFVFVLIAMSNLMGLIPFSLTSTSFAVMTFFAGLTMFIGINIIALASYNWKFVNLFLPSGAPLAIAPFLIIIETISYFARVMSLSIRLFANLLAGTCFNENYWYFCMITPLIIASLISRFASSCRYSFRFSWKFSVFLWVRFVICDISTLSHLIVWWKRVIIDYICRVFQFLVGVDIGWWMWFWIIWHNVGSFCECMVLYCLWWAVICMKKLRNLELNYLQLQKMQCDLKLCEYCMVSVLDFCPVVGNLKPADFSAQRQLGVLVC